MYKLIILDDDENIINMIKKHMNFEKLGISLAGTATNGIDGLNLIRSINPDIVLSDISMPGLSGLELLKKIKDLFINPLVILLTGHDSFQYAKEAISNNVFEYLTKPALPADIYEALEKAIVNLSSRGLYNEYALATALKTNSSTALNSCFDELYTNIQNSETLQLKTIKDIIFKFINTLFINSKNFNNLDISKISSDIEKLSNKQDLLLFFKQIYESNISNEYDVTKTTSRHSKYAQKAKDYIDTNYNDPLISINSVAEEVNVSTNYLRTIFKNEYSVSFKEYLTDLRMKKAKELLDTETHKIYAVAYMVGYKDVQQFRETFKKHYGTLPSKL